MTRYDSFAAQLDYSLDDGGVCKGGGVAQLIVLLGGNLSQDAPHDLS